MLTITIHLHKYCGACHVPGMHRATILALEGDMADIFKIGRPEIADAERHVTKAGLKPGLGADIIIFPGVRYDRSADEKGKTPLKKRAGRKSPGPSTRS